MRDEEKEWALDEVAQYLGYTGTSAAGSARKQLSRWGISATRRAPGRGGLSYYNAEEVKAAHARRPGQGYRSDLMDLARVDGITSRTTTIIERAREAHGGVDAFDYYTATNGVEHAGELFNQTHILVREQLTEATAADLMHKRARELWVEIQPELELYAAACRAAEWRGWSRESGGPVRRTG